MYVFDAGASLPSSQQRGEHLAGSAGPSQALRSYTRNAPEADPNVVMSTTGASPVFIVRSEAGRRAIEARRQVLIQCAKDPKYAKKGETSFEKMAHYLHECVRHSDADRTQLLKVLEFLGQTDGFKEGQRLNAMKDTQSRFHFAASRPEDKAAIFQSLQSQVLPLNHEFAAFARSLRGLLPARLWNNDALKALHMGAVAYLKSHPELSGIGPEDAPAFLEDLMAHHMDDVPLRYHYALHVMLTKKPGYVEEIVPDGPSVVWYDPDAKTTDKAVIVIRPFSEIIDGIGLPASPAFSFEMSDDAMEIMDPENDPMLSSTVTDKSPMWVQDSPSPEDSDDSRSRFPDPRPFGWAPWGGRDEPNPHLPLATAEISDFPVSHPRPGNLRPGVFGSAPLSVSAIRGDFFPNAMSQVMHAVDEPSASQPDSGTDQGAPQATPGHESFMSPLSTWPAEFF